MRCFVAAWPSPDVVEALAGLPRPMVSGVRWSGPSQWHVTLRFFGDLGPEGVLSAQAALSTISSWEGNVRAQGGPATRALGPGLVVWPVQGLERAARAIEAATAELGEPPARREFFGHITMARAKRGVDVRSVAQLWSPLTAGWDVRALHLVESRLHAAGARYFTVAEVPLPAI